MQLVTVHRILIGATIALGCLFAILSVWRFASFGGAADLGAAFLAAGTTAALTWYLRRFTRRLGRGDAGKPPRRRDLPGAPPAA